jgi:tetratricopeptide (TPR) repeat protein
MKWLTSGTNAGPLTQTILFVSFLLLVPSSFAQSLPGDVTDFLTRARAYAEREQWREAEEHVRLYLNVHAACAEAVVLHALTLSRLSQPFDAVLKLEEFLNSHPDSVPVLRLYGLLLDRVVRDRGEAEKMLSRATELAPADPEAWRDLGNFYVAIHQYADAGRAYSRGLEISESDPLLMAGLAHCYSQSDDSSRAEPLFQSALTLVGTSASVSPAVLLLYGEHLLRKEKTVESIALFDRLIGLGSHLDDAYYWRARGHERLKDWESTEADALACLQANSARKDAHQLLIRVYRAVGDSARLQHHVAELERLTREENAEQELGRRLRESLHKAEPLLGQGRFSEAAVHYEEITRLLPSFYEAHFALGICYFQMGRVSEAESSLRTYLSYQPLASDGYAALGVLLIQQGRTGESKASLKRAIQLDPRQIEARKALAHAHFWTGDFSEAIQTLAPLYADPAHCDADCFIMLARCHFALKEKERAVEICNRGLAQHRGSPDYLKGLGQLLLEEDSRSPQTTDVVTQIAGLLAADAEAQYLLAKLHYLVNRPRLCIDQLDRILAMAPDDPLAAAAWSLKGTALDRLNSTEEAESAFRKSQEINRRLPQPDPHAAIGYANFLSKELRHAEAQSLIDDILLWAPGFAPAHLEKAKFLAGRREHEKAVEAARTALQYSGNDQNLLRAAHAFLAKTYFQMGRREEAAFHQKQADVQ